MLPRGHSAAGLETEIVPYRVLMNQPKVVKVGAYSPAGQLLMKAVRRASTWRAMRLG